MHVDITTKIASVTDNESSRYALADVEVIQNGKGVFVSATDGRIAAVAHYEGEASKTPARIPGDLLPKTKKDLASDYRVKSDDGETWTRDKTVKKGSKATLTETTTEGRFPRVSDYLPALTGDETVITLDPSLLMQLKDALASEKQRGLTLFVRNGESCVAVLGRTGVGAIMPISVAKDNNPHNHRSKSPKDLHEEYEAARKEYVKSYA